MVWTRFFDLHSGGYRKFDFDVAYIELPEDEAIEYFTDRFQHPHSVTCDCCGEDYSVYECGVSPPEAARKGETVLIVAREDIG